MNHPLIEVSHLSKNYRVGKHLLYAVQDVSFHLNEGEVLGIGGESGCGKSTLGKLLMGFIEPTAGSILWNGKDLQEIQRKDPRLWQRHTQMIFQQAGASLNPRMTVERILSEPFIIHKIAHKDEYKDRIAVLLSQVGLCKEHLERFPHQLSGGQKQRVAIARALAIEPRLLLCDEPFAGLDVSIQAQVIQLLSQLQRERQLSYLIISHDLSILRFLAHKMAIMYLGHFIEWGPSEEVYASPLHPYTQALAQSILHADPIRERQSSRILLTGEIPSVKEKITGCPFYSRCRFAQAICQTTKPLYKEVRKNHFTACHLHS